MSAVETKSERVVQVGPDRVTVTEQEVVIEAKNAMPDWEVRDLNPVPVYFEDKKYYLLEQRAATRPYAVRYLLRRWPEEMFSSSKLFHSYDADAVSERDGGRRAENCNELARAFLLVIYPLLGLLWSRTQKRLTRFGFVPHLISGVSVFMVFCLTFGQGVFVVIMLQASARSGKMMIGGLVRALVAGDYIHIGPIPIPVFLLDSLLTFALIADFAIRYSRYLRDDQWSGGFLEWLVPRRWRRETAEE